MKVKMLSTAAGPEGIWPVHSLQDLPAEVAKALIAGGHAVGLRQVEPVAETAVVGPAEVAAVDPAEEKTILTPLEIAGKRKHKIKR